MEAKQQNLTESVASVAKVMRKKTRYFETYISRVLKNVASENGITSNAKQQLNSAICILARILSSVMTKLTVSSKKKTLSVKEVKNASILYITGTLLENAVKHAEESVVKFSQGETKHSSRQDKAGILFPPSITEKFLRDFGLSKVMVTKTAPIYFAAILEYLTTVILENASVLARENTRVRITIRDLEIAVRSDPDMNKLWEKCGISFIGGGVIPQIHDSLLAKKPRRKRKVKDTATATKKGHRFRPGTVSLREIKKYQKASNCLTFAKFPFERLVRSVISEQQEGMKISKDVFIVLQYYIEQFIVDFLRDAGSAAIHSGRVKLMPSDIQFISNLRHYPQLDATPFKKEKKVETEDQQEGQKLELETV
uniref:Core Histone H2A/H2B/H3 domain-containing protein n=1 Tax=viral metagenome TaxID=1070528 RepID=A0A6C0EQ89_9ZZZZ